MEKIMTFDDLKKISVDTPDQKIYSQIRKNWDSISKPIDGLGDFEDLICRIGAMRREIIPDISKRCAVIICADSHITEEGVSQCGSHVTKDVAVCLGRDESTVCVMAAQAHTDVYAVDMGIDTDETISGVIDMKVNRGAGNFLKAPAMTEEEVLKAIYNGIHVAKSLSDKGYGLIAAGEMGIGNTTTATALLCALTHTDPGDVTGRGAGLDDAGLSRKKEVIRQGLKIYEKDNTGTDKERAFKMLMDLGSLDIAGLAGLYIGGAIDHVPVIIDGLISAVAAMTAQMIVPGVKEYMIPSHAGRERGTMQILEKLGFTPFINGNMALGEATGAVMMIPLMDMALALYTDGIRFGDAGIDAYERYDHD